MNTSKFTILIIVLFVCLWFAATVIAVPPPAVATCKITCTVSEIVEWSDTSFPQIDLGDLNQRREQAAGEAELLLYTNGDIVITADNSGSAELSSGSQTLTTEYQLQYDGSGEDQTGGMPTEWCTFDSFLKEPSKIKHVQTDGAVVIILSVKASVEKVTPEMTGEYNATQTLTACWNS